MSVSQVRNAIRVNSAFVTSTLQHEEARNVFSIMLGKDLDSNDAKIS